MLWSAKPSQGSIRRAPVSVPPSDSPAPPHELPILPPESAAPQQSEPPVTLPEVSGSPLPSSTTFHRLIPLSCPHIHRPRLSLSELENTLWLFSTQKVID